MTWKASPKWYPNFSAATAMSESRSWLARSAADLQLKAIKLAVLQ